MSENILEQALLRVEKLEEALKQNAKGILGSVMKQELNELLKESMEEENEEETPSSEEEETKDVSEQPADDEESDDEESDDTESDDTEDSTDDSTDLDNDSLDSDDDSLDASGDEVSSGDDEFSSGEDEFSSDDEFSSGEDEFSSDDEFSSEDEDDVMDMTGASDDEVLKVFKAMKPEDGIIVKKDGEDIELDMEGDEYIIKLDDEMDDSSEMPSEMSDEEFSEGSEWGDEELSSSDDEELYEVELEEEDSEEEPKKGKKIEASEAARTKWNPHGDKGGQNRTGLKSKKMFKAGSGSLNEEVSKLKKQNNEYKKALVLFKEKLNEVAVFNASLAYATRLFTEHSTTKKEKLNILKRFDKASTMNESKNLYNTIKTELETKKPVTEAVVEKISTNKSSSSKEVLSEAKAYESPQLKRMKDLMNKIK
jgi:hypothetical protein